MKYGFIGCGNMGGAIARALRRSTADIMLCDRSGKGRELARELGVAYGTAQQIVQTCDRIFLAVKPHMMQPVLEPLRPELARRRPLLITMAAGLDMQKIADFAGEDLGIIRIMPNTPTAIGQGVIPYCCTQQVEEESLRDWLADMQPCGLLDALEERLMDAASALSGSGPAYMYLFLEALADGAVACGLPRGKAMNYAAMTMAGAASTPSMAALRRPPASRARTASMVLPPGEHTASFSAPGCVPVVRYIWAAPAIVMAA